jgi:threonine aldolase
MALEGRDGKVSGDLIREAYKLHWEDGAHEHITQPKLVYISNPTELGTIYSKAELEDIRRACDECHMYLFLDGARLGYGLMSKENDLTMEDIAKNCDVFYIGGTKVGALFGEAVVITNPALQEDFRYIIKQKGGMLAKGRLLGIQFLELFKDGLYFEISEHAMKMAELLKDGLLKLGYEFYADSPTNQQFVIVSNKKLKELEENFSYEPMQAYGEDKRVVRFCTSWATKEEDVRALLEVMNRFEFRDILPEEADQAATIEQICFPPHEACSEAMMKERVAKVSELFLVAVDKESGKIAGFLNGLATDEKGFRDEFFKDSGLHNPTGSYVMLCGLDVLPQYRGQGLATEIMQQYIQRETKRGRKQLILTCLEEKISMYEKMGYRNNGIANSTWGNEEWYEMIYELN